MFLCRDDRQSRGGRHNNHCRASLNKHTFRVGRPMLGISPLSSLFYTLGKAGMSVEAILVIPFFLFFMMNILFCFDILRLQSGLAQALHQAGNEITFSGYACKYGLGESNTVGVAAADLLSVPYARNRVIDTLGNSYLDHTCLSGGSAGLDFSRSRVMVGIDLTGEEDVVDLVALYRIRPFIRSMGFPEFKMWNRYYGKAWTGYEVGTEQSGLTAQDPMVYVTDTGTVYHTNRHCAYLNPDVSTVDQSVVGELRNQYGGKYYPCESCKGVAGSGSVYITGQGNRYHGTLSCPALKRTIYTIPLSEAAGRSCCSKCGGTI